MFVITSAIPNPVRTSTRVSVLQKDSSTDNFIYEQVQELFIDIGIFSMYIFVRNYRGQMIGSALQMTFFSGS